MLSGGPAALLAGAVRSRAPKTSPAWRCCGRRRRRGSCWPLSNTRSSRPGAGGRSGQPCSSAPPPARSGLLRTAPVAAGHARRGLRSVPDLRPAVSGNGHDALRAAAGRAGCVSGGDRARGGDAPLGSLRPSLASLPSRSRSAQPTLIAYASEAAPAFRMLADMRAETGRSDAAPVLAMHRRQEFDLRRPFEWVGADAPVFARQLAAPPKHEWLELVKYWNGGGRATGRGSSPTRCAATSRSSTTARRARRIGGRSVSASSSAVCGRTRWTGTRSTRRTGTSARAGR